MPPISSSWSAHAMRHVAAATMALCAGPRSTPNLGLVVGPLGDCGGRGRGRSPSAATGIHEGPAALAGTAGTRGLRLRRRSVLASAARRVLLVLPRAGSGRHGSGMTGPWIERVRERLASESGPAAAQCGGAAIRAESGGCSATPKCWRIFVLQTELTGAGILEPLLSADGTTDALVTAPDSVRVDDGTIATQPDSVC